MPRATTPMAATGASQRPELASARRGSDWARPGPDDRVLADRDAVEDFRARAKPRAVANRHASRFPRLGKNRRRGIGEVVVAADDVTVSGHQHVLPHRHPAGREDLAIEADV